jgi:hypothetical protein
MKYRKPQITSIREAAPAIQSFNRKFLALLVDSLNVGYLITIIASEADE